MPKTGKSLTSYLVFALEYPKVKKHNSVFFGNLKTFPEKKTKISFSSTWLTLAQISRNFKEKEKLFFIL
jgi:hypothetical protein